VPPWELFIFQFPLEGAATVSMLVAMAAMAWALYKVCHHDDMAHTT